MKTIEIEIKDIIVFILLLSLLTFSCFFYYTNIRNIVGNRKFVNELIQIYSENKDPIFKINKIILYSSADAIDKSEGNLLQDISIHQFSDIAIYIDNTSYIKDLSSKNTVKGVYIENINLNTNFDIGKKFINYKNPLSFGNIEYLSSSIQEINFNIIKTNDENIKSDYNSPVFFADCSNPISLGYLNLEILTNYIVPEEGRAISFDGSILKKANINIEDLKCDLSLRIKIKNNLDEEFVCNFTINNIVGNDDIYNGYFAREYNPTGVLYNFFKL